MRQKKPIWTTAEAHERLKSYCQASGRTQLQVVSELILTHLDAAGRQPIRAEAKPKKIRSEIPREVSPELAIEEADSRVKGKPFGGVWVV